MTLWSYIRSTDISYLRINNMNSEKMIITGIVAHGICSKCGTKRILYFTPIIIGD